MRKYSISPYPIYPSDTIKTYSASTVGTKTGKKKKPPKGSFDRKGIIDLINPQTK